MTSMELARSLAYSDLSGFKRSVVFLFFEDMLSVTDVLFVLFC